MSMWQNKRTKQWMVEHVIAGKRYRKSFYGKDGYKKAKQFNRHRGMVLIGMKRAGYGMGVRQKPSPMVEFHYPSAHGRRGRKTKYFCIKKPYGEEEVNEARERAVRWWETVIILNERKQNH